jgi:hypothetical protein
MQRCIILFIIVNALHVSSGFSAHHQELKSVQHTQTSPNSSTLAVTANKFDKYLMLHVEIWVPDDKRKNRSKHVERGQ